MSGITQATFMNLRSFGPPPPFTVIGGPSGGGFWAGDISTGANGVATHHLVVSPLSSGQFFGVWKNSDTSTPGADSRINGPQNTADMVADGNSTVYPCAHFCNNAVIGGFSDWYMPAFNELDVCYFNLKPTTQPNNTLAGQGAGGPNDNSVPKRSSTYTSGTPAQTSAAAFKEGKAQAFSTDDFYWNSEQFVIPNFPNFHLKSAHFQSFFNGRITPNFKYKNTTAFVRCIRRVPV